MCGIAGERRLDGGEVRHLRAPDMLRVLAHRGPDGWGCYLDPERKNMLLHTRLSIMDVAGGAQPLTSRGGDLVTIVNGEIYDFEEQRRQLAKRGHTFRTDSDSEVVLHLYEDEGDRFVHSLRGEFALALLDRRRRRLVLARDRLGVKPLYWWQRNGTFLFASEVKGIFAHGGPERRIDLDSMAALVHGLEPTSGSMFESVQAVVPGHLLVCSDAGVESTPYWDISFPRDASSGGGSPAAGAARREEQLGALLEDAVRVRCRSDVPVGVYLSGGIDSTSVAALARRHLPRLPAFTVGFEDPLYDETPQAERTAAELGLPLHVTRVAEGTLSSMFRRSVWHCERPLMNGHGTAKMELSALARRHVKVVLTGEGADEVFAGYDQYRHIVLLEALRKDPDDAAARSGLLALRRGRTLLSGVSRDDSLRGAEEILRRFGALPYTVLRANSLRGRAGRFLSAEMRAHLAVHDPLDTLARALDLDRLAGRSGVSATQYVAIKASLPNYILNVVGDRMEMASSLEGRLPFLDHPLVEFAATVPAEERVDAARGKVILRRAMRGLIPDEVVERPKHIFQAPSHSSLFTGGGEARRLRELFGRTVTRRVGLFDAGIVRFLLRVSPWLPRSWPRRAWAEAAMTLVASTHMLHALFVESFEPPEPESPLFRRDPLGRIAAAQERERGAVVLVRFPGRVRGGR